MHMKVETYNSLYDVCEVVTHCDEQSSFLCVSRADFIDPGENEWAGAKLWDR
jgi:hypothetical protein